MTRGYVVDANVVLTALMNHPLAAKAGALFDRARRPGDLRLLAPALLHVEVANGLWSYARHAVLDPDRTRIRLRVALQLPIRTVSVRLLVVSGLELALSRGITVYDALYGALARAEGLPLVTLDRRLLEALPAAGVAVVSLADLS